MTILEIAFGAVGEVVDSNQGIMPVGVDFYTQNPNREFPSSFAGVNRTPMKQPTRGVQLKGLIHPPIRWLSTVTCQNLRPQMLVIDIPAVQIRQVVMVEGMALARANIPLFCS